MIGAASAKSLAHYVVLSDRSTKFYSVWRDSSTCLSVTKARVALPDMKDFADA